MDGRCLDDAADRAFGTDPGLAPPRRRRFRRRPLRRFVAADPAGAEPAGAESTLDEEPETPQS